MPISPSRRGFLGSLAAAATALVARPAPAGAAAPGQTPPLPAIPASGRLDEAFWRSLRPQFLIPPDEAFFNTGTLGSQPRVVLDAVTRHMTHVVRDVAHWDYKAQNEQYFTGYAPETGVRQKLAALINAHVDEVALTQNATMAMSFVANGVDLGPGDEVIVMQNAHTGGRGGWELRGKRYGAHVRRHPDRHRRGADAGPSAHRREGHGLRRLLLVTPQVAARAGRHRHAVHPARTPRAGVGDAGQRAVGQPS
jgi:hypothetical protein